MKEIEGGPMYENVGTVAMRRDLLINQYRFCADHARNPRQKMRNLRIYWDLVGKSEKGQNEK